jgi:small conductance mechanosensitive channel
VVVHTDGLRIFGLIAEYRAILLRDFSDRILRVVFIVIGAEIFRRLVMLLAHHTIVRSRAGAAETETQRELRARTLSNVINGTATVVIYIWAFILVLQALGMNIAAVLTGVGIAGLAIGFGAQSLVKDFIGGFYILLENQYRVGDLVDIADRRGVVEQITMRSTRLRNSLDGIVHVIPNGEIHTVSNLSFLWSRHEAKIGVSYNADPDEVLAILERVGRQMREEEPWSGLLMDDPKVLGLDEFADSALVFKVVFQTEPLQQFTVGREYKRRLFYAFKEAGIEIPFPHRTVYHRQDEGGNPFRVLTEGREPQESDQD